MNKFIKSLLVALAVIPCAAVFAACDGTTTPPSYEISEGGHSFSEYSGFSIQTAATGYDAYFQYTDKNLAAILSDYADRLDDEYYPELTLEEEDEMLYDGDTETIETVLRRFINGENFVMTVPNAENKYSGLLTITTTTDYDAPALTGCTDLEVTINQQNGDMQIANAPSYYGKTYVDYSYKNGVITVEVNAAEIIKELARENEVDEITEGYIPPLWIQFTLS